MNTEHILGYVKSSHFPLDPDPVLEWAHQEIARIGSFPTLVFDPISAWSSAVSWQTTPIGMMELCLSRMVAESLSPHQRHHLIQEVVFHLGRSVSPFQEFKC